MSLILEALKKADQERQADETTPSLESTHNVEAMPEQNTLWLIIIIAAFCVIASVLVTYLFLARKSALDPTPPNIAVSAPQVDKLAAAPAQNQGNKYTKAQEEAIQAQYPTRKKEQEISTEEKQPEILALYEKEKLTKKSLENALRGQTPKAKSSSEKKLAEKRTATKAAKPRDNQKAKTLANYAHVKFIQDLPQSVQDSIPSMMYTEHNYAQGNRKSHVVINGKQFLERSSIGDGVILETILKDGVLLKSGKNQFKMAALNSWLNF